MEGLTTEEPCQRGQTSENSHTALKAMQTNPFTDDDIYKALKKHFHMHGKGRRPDLPCVNLTHGLLLQLYYLKEEGNHTYRELKSWLEKLVPSTVHVTEGCITHQVQTVLKVHSGLSAEKSKSYLATSYSFHALAEPLAKLGLNRLHLINCEQFTGQAKEDVSNDVVIALEQFRAKEDFPVVFVRKWLRLLSLACANFTDSQMRTRVQKVVKQYNLLAKNKVKNAQALCNFFNMPFVSQPFHVHIGPEVENNTVECHDCIHLRECLREKDKIIKALERDNEYLVNSKNFLSAQLEIKDQVRDLQDEKKNEKTESQVKDELAGVKKKIIRLKKQRDVISVELGHVQKSKLYKHNHKLKRDIKTMANKNVELKKKLCAENGKNADLVQTVNKLKVKLKSEQTLKAKVKSSLNKQKCLTKNLQIMLQEDKYDKTVLRHTGSTHRYLDHVRQTYYALQGEANVAATNCSKVVEIVAKHMFDTDLKEQLPSATTSLNFASEAHIIAKHQVADEILNSSHFTFACDGTSRQKAHYIEQHIILSNGKSLSLGFSEIASDDSQTLLEQCIGIFQNISEIYCLDESSDQHMLMKEIIRKLKALLSDRASVMKAFDAKMSQFKYDLLDGEESSLHFLFCNAHFLLALASAAEDGVRAVEVQYVEGGQKLGKDAKPLFSSFSTSNECAALRLIRTASEVLGPRGDEKSGCREEWLAFCSSRGLESLFTSYRCNRFNNLFQNASALLCHKQDIQVFLQEYASHSNLKLQSVLADLQDPRIINSIASLSVFDVFFTSPYWRLMNSNTSYADFAPYVKKMSIFLKSWSCADFIHTDICNLSSVFDDFEASIKEASVLSKFFESDCFVAALFSLCMKKVSEKCSAALDRQLSDFLEGGAFGGELDEDVKVILKTCPLTNLTGERLFGDFDFDLNKRRNASIHIRSTTSMWKHNATRRWLDKQSIGMARKLVRKAIQYGPEWKKKSKEATNAVKEKIKIKIAENKRLKDEKEVKRNERKLAALDAILTEGACVLATTKEDLDTLYNGPKALEKLKAQIRYRSLVRGEKISMTGTKRVLYERLLHQISS
ncbi:hypothetical protein PoB_006780700 [Plakobranchus ocellatus]|uniref:Uncharacterized protein n=1 Tax=Plakobranchus ocellatus TaxID=259542 RepID=A0AAV4DBA5_9GAST|nr:hypothetical protein PoB_006780700 [Plakobranchus ocellatus]